MRRTRLLLMGTGTVVMCGLVLLAALLIPSRPAKHATRHAVRCTRDTAIKVIRVCGQKVLYSNPDGTVVVIGNVHQLYTPHAHVLMAMR